LQSAASGMPLGGRSILVVEDSYFVAMSMKRILAELGAVVVGPAASVDDAMSLLERSECDGAVLDVNLGDETAQPVAELLARRGVPFIFVTGYSDPDLPEPLRLRPRVSKPIQPDDLRAAIIAGLNAQEG
jgi:CheY-like chemotaxis protein